MPPPPPNEIPSYQYCAKFTSFEPQVGCVWRYNDCIINAFDAPRPRHCWLACQHTQTHIHNRRHGYNDTITRKQPSLPRALMRQSHVTNVNMQGNVPTDIIRDAAKPQALNTNRFIVSFPSRILTIPKEHAKSERRWCIWRSSPDGYVRRNDITLGLIMYLAKPFLHFTVFSIVDILF